MARRKKYEPHCPAWDCQGGHEARLYPITAEAVRLTAEVLKRRRGESSVYRCNYCGFIWLQSPRSPVGFDPTPAGKLDSQSGRFEELPITFEIREGNTRAYWNAHFEKLRKKRARPSHR